MKTNNFSVMPSVSISRSKFKRKSQYKTSAKLGEIIPVYLDEVLPGDTRKIDFGALCRLSNPIAPVMDNIYLDFYAFFVPNRLTWIHWKEFMGENSSGAGIYSGTAYTIPTVNLGSSTISAGCVGDYMGIPKLQGKSVQVSALPIRAYRLIYNRFFRDQNVIAPLTVTTTDTGNLTYDNYAMSPCKAAKLSDYFTRALPYAQKGAAVTIPLGNTADVKLFNSSSGTFASGSTITLQNQLAIAPTKIGDVTAYNSNVTAHGPLVADLSTATAATINQLRFAFQYQKMLEKDALYGTRYWEILKAHFGVVAPDSSLQDPEFLGHHRMNINIDQVIQTTGIDQATPANNELGQVAAVSVSGGKGSLFTKSFTEHGYLMVVAVMRHDQTYGQGLERHWSRKSRTDFYFPVFANLGAQEVKNKEIFITSTTTSTQDEGIFGYQEAWAEYRYKPSKVTGILNPSQTNSLGYWTLANNFASLPTLGQTFIEQDRNAIGRLLATGASGPDYILDMMFIDTAVRPMPLYSVPGLIDHH